jgi:hypothetical protein
MPYHTLPFGQIAVLKLGDQVYADVSLRNPELFTFQYSMTQVDPGQEFLRLEACS